MSKCDSPPYSRLAACAARSECYMLEWRGVDLFAVQGQSPAVWCCVVLCRLNPWVSATMPAVECMLAKACLLVYSVDQLACLCCNLPTLQ